MGGWVGGRGTCVTEEGEGSCHAPRYYWLFVEEVDLFFFFFLFLLLLLFFVGGGGFCGGARRKDLGCLWVGGWVGG